MNDQTLDTLRASVREKVHAALVQAVRDYSGPAEMSRLRDALAMTQAWAWLDCQRLVDGITGDADETREV